MARALTFLELPGWSFTAYERSPGIYVVRGEGGNGLTVESAGCDYEEMLASCKAWAADHLVVTDDEPGE